MLRKIVIWVVVIALIAGGAWLIFFNEQAAYVEDISPEELRRSYELLSGSLNTQSYKYTDFLLDRTAPDGSGSAEAAPSGGAPVGKLGLENADPAVLAYPGDALLTNYLDEAAYTVNVPTAGVYVLALEYASQGESYLDFTVTVAVNGVSQYQELQTVELPLYWRDSVEEFQTDRYGDEIAPSQDRVAGWRRTYLYNNTCATVAPLLVELKAGENTVTVTNVSNDGLLLGKLTAEAPAAQAPTYEEYLAALGKPVTPASGESVAINAVDYVEKNSAQIIYETTASPAVTPYDPEYKKLNTLSWTGAGDCIDYAFTVPADGFYTLGLHYRNEKEEFNSYETILIDGAAPFRELECYAFGYTGTSWGNEVLSDGEGNPYYIYLTAGEHTLTLKAELEPVTAAMRYGQLIAEHVTKFALDIKKIAGTDADEYRTWKMTEYIPEIPSYLEAYKLLMRHIRYLLQDETENGINGALLSYLDKAEKFVDEIYEYPDEIALHVNSMTGRDNSILVAVSNFNSAIIKLDFSLDMIYLSGDGQMPRANPNALQSLGNTAKTTYYSFVTDKYSVNNETPETLTVWVNRAVTHVDLLQKMVDTGFTQETGIPVKLSVMPDPTKLTLAAAADVTPDVALGLASHMPFDMACRGALYDMTQFPDFWQVSNRFVAGAMVPYVYNEGVYAIPETLDFGAVIYRTDIFTSLGLQVPDTWDELRAMLPALQRYGMNFYHNISSGVGYKWFFQTTPLIFQNGGKLYNDEGTATAIDSPASVAGLKELGDLFVAYSLDTQVNEFFNSFRYNVLPIGIVDSNTYNLIKNGAVELDGQWELSPYLGTVQEDGSIDRWYVANGTGGVIFADTDKAQAAWDFLKWWTREDTQIEYTYNLRSTYGNTYFWLPSNLEALRQAPIDQEDKMVILDMVQWLRDVPRTPGQYLLERSISDIWNAMVLDGSSAQVVADEKSIDINREIRKKMQEMGFYDKDGNLLKPYVIRDVDWIQEQMDRAGKEES